MPGKRDSQQPYQQGLELCAYGELFLEESRQFSEFVEQEDLMNATGMLDSVFRKHVQTPHLTSDLIFILFLQGPNVCLIQALTWRTYLGDSGFFF